MSEAPVAPGSPATGRIAALDGLRGLAVLLVVVMHYYVVVPTPADVPFHYTLRQTGSLFHHGVDLFFVLSGFFIGGILLDHRGSPRLLRSFYFRRALRILPLYILLLAAVFIGREVPGLNAVYRGRFFASVLPDWPFFAFLQNFWMVAHQDMGPHWLSVTWSLAIEEQFYLLLPLVLLRLSPRQLALGCVVLLLASPLFRIVTILYTKNPFAASLLLPTHADGLLCGVLCALAARSTAAMAALRRQRRALGLLLGAFVLGAAIVSTGALAAESVTASIITESSGLLLLALGFAGVLLHVLAFPQSALARCLAWAPLAWVGLVSYFVYLFHRPVWYVLHWLILGSAPVHHTLQAGALTVVSLGVTLALAWCSWRWLEAPLLRLARRSPY
ncbi:MAG: acyltransferase [Verrucomicrobiota bacterium]